MRRNSQPNFISTARWLLSGAALLASIAAAQAAAPATPQGVITARAFLNIGGTAVADLTGNPKFPDHPDVVNYYSYFEWNASGDISTPPTNWADNYGTQIIGYFYPPVSGDYVFFLAGDDGSNLYLSTDADPANKKLIAQEAGWSGIRSWETVGGGSTVEAKNSSLFTGTQWPTKDTATGGAKITLEANKPYYIEALAKEGGGGDNLAVAVQAPDGSIDATLPIPGQYLSSIDKTTGPLSIVTQPQSLSLNEGAQARFTIVLEGTPPYTYQWKNNGTDIPDATNAVYVIDRVSRTDTGGKFTVAVTGAQGSLTSTEATLTVSNDTTPPAIQSAAGSSTFNYVTVTFSEPLDPTTAENADNYKLSGGVTVSAAKLAGPAGSARDNRVILTTSIQPQGANLTLTVSNVKDVPGNVIQANTTFEFLTASFTPGFATYERWHNEVEDPGGIDAFASSIADGSIRTPDFSGIVTQFGGPWGVRDNYSGRVSGFFIPPSNGNYVFFVGADDQAIVYLSTDENPANRKIIARERNWSNQYQFVSSGGGSPLEDKRSDQFTETEWPTGGAITLEAGKRYYMEVLWDEGGGGDGADVTYKLESEPDPTDNAAGMKLRGNVIGTMLSPDAGAPSIIDQPQNATVASGGTATFTVKAIGAKPLTYQWQRAGVDIPGATSTNLTVSNAGTSNFGIYTVVVSNSEGSITSTGANLTVTGLPTVLFIHASGGPNDSDRAAMNRLISKGWQVTGMGASTSQTSDATGKALVVISSTISSGEVGDKFQTVETPVLNWEAAVEDNFDMTDRAGDTDGVTRGVTASQTQLNIVKADHAMAAGLPAGMVAFANAQDASWGVVGAGATVIATIADNPEHAALYVYDKGATLFNGDKAPGIRIHFPAGDNTFLALTPDGLKLFDAAVDYATGAKPSPGGNVAISKAGNQITITYTGTLQAADSVTGPYSAVPAATSPYTVTASGTAKFYIAR